jgi:hypothetical protein
VKEVASGPSRVALRVNENQGYVPVLTIFLNLGNCGGKMEVFTGVFRVSENLGAGEALVMGKLVGNKKAQAAGPVHG